MTKHAITAVIGLLMSLGGPAARAGRGDLDPGYGEGGRLAAATIYHAPPHSSDIVAVNLPDDRLMTVEEGLVRRFDREGRLDPTFGNNGETTLPPFPAATPFFSVLINPVPTPDGGLVIAGLLSDDLGTMHFETLIRLDHDGQLLTTFGGNGDGLYRLTAEPIPELCGGICTALIGVVVDQAGRVLLAKRGLNDQGQCTGTPSVERLTPDGSIDPTFGADGAGDITGVDLCTGALVFGARDDGSVVVGDSSVVVRLDATGVRDAAFGAAGQLSLASSVAWSAAQLLPDGSLLLAGARQAPDEPGTVLARFDATGQVDAQFGDGTGGVQHDLGAAFFGTTGLQLRLSALASTVDGGLIYLQVSLTRSSGESGCASGIARLNRDGTVDASFGDRGLSCLDYGAFPFVLIGLQRNGAPLFGQLDGNVYRLLLNATESPGYLTLAQSGVLHRVRENAGSATMNVVRTAGQDGAVSVHLYTQVAPPDPRSRPPGTDHIADAGSDYRTSSERLEWADGEAGTRSQSVAVLDDRVEEDYQVFLVEFDDLQGGVQLHGLDHVVVGIDDDDDPALAGNTPAGGGGSTTWPALLSLAALVPLAGRRRRTRIRTTFNRQSNFVPALVTALSICVLFAPARASANDSVERWNTAMTDYAAGQPPPGIPPFVEARGFSMAHIAMLDALRIARRSTAPANVDAAIAAAAHDVLMAAFAPFGPSSFDSTYQDELARIPNGPAETRGVSIGQRAAAAMLATRADEDIFAALGAPYTPGTKPGDYQATPPVGAVVGAGWSKLRTFAVRSSKQFRAPRPYSSLRSLDYATDVNEIELFGKAIDSARTTDQTAIAFYWYENSSFAWNRIARKLAGRLSLLEHARLFAALNAAISDAYSTSLESKFYYNLWRPITAIHAAGTDGNPLTIADDTWEPAFATPPVPDYPSAHSAAGGAAAEVIDAMVGRGRAFTHVSTTGPISGVPGAGTRSFSSVQNAAIENAYSRMLVGIHFRRACTAGLEQGRDIGRYVVEHAEFLQD